MAGVLTSAGAGAPPVWAPVITNLYDNMTAAGDIEYGTGLDTGAILGIGTAGQVLKVNAAGTAPEWANEAELNLFDTPGDILYAAADNSGARLGIGTAGQILRVNAGATAPEYANQYEIIDAAGDLIYGNAADSVAKLPVGTAGQRLAVNAGATAPEWVDPELNILDAAGDMIYATADNTPARLPVGALGTTLRSDGTNPVWDDDSFLFADNTTVAPATAGQPTNAEIQAFAGALRNKFFRYTGDDTAASPTTHIFYIDTAGAVETVEAPGATANNRFHLTATAVAAANVVTPTAAEIQAAVTAAGITDRLAYYTGTDIATDAVTYAYDVDAAGVSTPVFASTANTTASRIELYRTTGNTSINPANDLPMQATSFTQGGDLSLGPTGGVQGLVAGKTYRIKFRLNLIMSQIASLQVGIIEGATNTVLRRIDADGATPSGTYFRQVQGEMLYTPAANTEVFLRAVSAGGTPQFTGSTSASANDVSVLIVEEVATTQEIPLNGLYTNDQFAISEQMDLGDMRVLVGGGTGGTAVNFATAFSAVPRVFVSPDGFTGQAASASVTTTGFTPQTSDSGGSTVNSAVSWMAVGPR